MVKKVTFTLDDQTIRQIESTAQKLNKPKSEIVREAVADYHARAGRLSEAERLQLLKSFDELVPRIPRRSSKNVDRELEQIREARRDGGRGRKR